ncbi:MlaD family protein [Oryzomonas rubra]|uniref:MCE family protein n=1 Tax=Oryzomonas rubra TaxID=2509454 RepID=A0A5A9XEY5_9BACT|nr:MlaD family protein [Oryzomonas rubra]KAA0891424.1 MCE family protein [Oryzomonas rubra]
MTLSHEAKVGLFFILSIVLFGLMLELGNRWKIFDRGVPYKVFLSSTTGLKQGDAVKLAGVEVGTISKIAVQDNRVQVDFEVKPGTHIKQDTVASIRMTSMLGGQFLGLSFGSPTSPELPPGSTVKSTEAFGIDAIMDNVGGLTKDAKQLIVDLNRNQNEVMTKISTILDENRSAVNTSLKSISSITTKIDRGEGALGMLVNDKQLGRDIRDVAGSLKTVSARLERGEGTAGKLLTDDRLYTDALATVREMRDGMGSLNRIAARIDKGEGTAGKLVNDPALYDELKATVVNLKEITRKINSGEGTIGKLVNDDKLYLNAISTLKKTEKTMEGLQDTGPISVIGSVIGTLF